jgi:DNA-binding beta-propeller fold protein YncE
VQERSEIVKAFGPHRVLAAAAAIAFCLCLGEQAPTASAAAGDPLLVLRPEPHPFSPLPPIPPPVGGFEGPCGLGVDAQARFYVADYYHHVIDVYTSAGVYLTQLAGEDPLDGPCGLALDPAGNLYVNNFHRNVVRFSDASNFGSGTVVAGVGADSSYPTGAAVDGSGTVFVDERDHLATFDSAGTEGEPIGIGSLEDGHGVAVSAYPATAGYLYVPDAATNTVKVFDPATSRTAPVAELDGSGTPPGHFVSLRNASVAVDDFRGTVYVVDDLTPEYKEGHEAVVYGFDATGAYLGRLKNIVETALPAGLAVDNSDRITQGRVYVTSGYTEVAAVFAYAPGSLLTGLPSPAAATAPSAPAASLPASSEQLAIAAAAPAQADVPAQAPAYTAPSASSVGQQTAPAHAPRRAKAKAHKHHRGKHQRAARRKRR